MRVNYKTIPDLCEFSKDRLPVSFPAVNHTSYPHRLVRLPNGFDFIFARELTGGLYFGERYTKKIDGVMTGPAMSGAEP